MSALNSCWPGNTTGLPLTNPCSFPKAIKLPVKVSVPTKTDRAMVDRVKDVISPDFVNSAAATRADAPPPNPLNMATI